MREIFLHNDHQETTRPIVGPSLTTGRRGLYHSTEVVTYITDEPGGTEPVGSLSASAPEIGETGRYTIAFDTAAVDSSLSGLEDGTVLYRVLSGPGDLRVEDPITLRHVRPSDPV